jgi:cobalt-zinc-cadmium resistance protein CzcA
MLRSLVAWSLANPIIVLLMAATLGGFGLYAFHNVNIEAYPDPAPPIFEIVAQYPGASAEEVERQVTIPLEVALAGMPGLTSSRSKSLFGLAFLNNQFDYGVDYHTARQEVLNRIASAELPPGVTAEISPRFPIGEFFRYRLDTPRDPLGQPIYDLNDLKALQDWTLQREFRRVPRIADVASFGGTVKRYEIHPDPERLRKSGITLGQLADAVSRSNANIGGDYLIVGRTAQTIRGLGLIGGGRDPAEHVRGMSEPAAVRDYLRAEERERIRQIRQIVVTTINNIPVRVEDLVDGGPLIPGEMPGRRGVIVGSHTRLGKVVISRPLLDEHGRELLDSQGERLWIDEDEVVQGLVLLRRGEDSLPALASVKAKIDEINNDPGRLLPGVRLEPFYDRTELIHLTTETVLENLLIGMSLVGMVLVMFLSNVRCALIVAINVPLALLVAFSMLFLRGESANLLSIGAVDFGIIVDSSVIMVENIFRHLRKGVDADQPLARRILNAFREIEKALLYSTIIMVCAFIPLFTMKGPEGRIFGPMAHTYAFALGGALILAVTLSPVLCLLLLKRLKPSGDNLVVGWLKGSYLRQLQACLRFRWLTLAAFALAAAATIFLILPQLGREFMPELDEGVLWVRGMFPRNVSLEENAEKSRVIRQILRGFPEVRMVMGQLGRPDSGVDPTGFYSAEYFVPLKDARHWPAVKEQRGWRAWLFGPRRPRTKLELVEEMNDQLSNTVIGVEWNFSQPIRDNVMEVLSGVQGENAVKIIGPDLEELERLGAAFEKALAAIPGIKNPAAYRITGPANLEFPIDRDKCALWGVSVADVHGVIETAVGGKPFTTMIEGERSFDITLRWPARLRSSEEAILDIPIDVTNNQVSTGLVASQSQTPLTGSSVGISAIGTSLDMPALTGSRVGATYNDLRQAPRRRLRDFVTPPPSSSSTPQYVRPGVTMIFREQGQRQIAVKFSVRGRDLASTVAEAQRRTASLLPPPYRAAWSGEFQEMEEAERRLQVIIPLSLGLVLILLYLAFRSFTDSLLVFSNVLALSLGGIWALWLTNTSFSVSAAVGFVSIFGVAIMDGLLLISSFNHLRLQGLSIDDAILEGAARRARPMMMTSLTAIFGLLPAAVSTRIGVQSQRPLAIVVVGAMLTTLLLARYLMPVLYRVFRHRPPAPEAGSLAH